jgi:hypothetical protein
MSLHIATDLINALPGNSSVNTVQHTTVEEAVFSVSAGTSHNSRYLSRDVFAVCLCSLRQWTDWVVIT